MKTENQKPALSDSAAKQNAEPKRPVIGIVQGRSQIQTGSFTGTYRVQVTYPYVAAVERCGGVPLTLPFTEDRSVLEAQLACCDGVILSGGADIDAHLYGEEPAYGQGHFDRTLDLYYIGIARTAAEKGIPVLGICKGIQALAVAFGGKLIQDIGRELPSAVLHDQDAPPGNPCHYIDIMPGSFLDGIYPAHAEVNSFHHQAVKELPKAFRAAANASDGVIEAMEAADGRPIYGVQWHPEMSFAAGDETAESLFRWFVGRCRETLYF